MAAGRRSTCGPALTVLDIGCGPGTDLGLVVAEMSEGTDTFPAMSDLGFLDLTRSSYDAVAAGYSTLFVDELPGQPVKRSLLTLFAELASGRTADVGCGPGHVTAFLRGQGWMRSGSICRPAWSSRPGPTIRSCSSRSAR